MYAVKSDERSETFILKRPAHLSASARDMPIAGRNHTSASSAYASPGGHLASMPTGISPASSDELAAAVRISVNKSLSCCAFSFIDAERAPPDDAIVIHAGLSLWQVAFGAAHVWVRDAQDAPLKWLDAVAKRRPRRVTLQGNSYAFGHPWFALACVAMNARSSAPRRVPFHALATSVEEALDLDAQVRLLAADRDDARVALNVLRGSEHGVRTNDIVWLWRQRRLTRITELHCGAQTVQRADLRTTPGLRVHTPLGVVQAADVDVALVQTPATMRGRTEAVAVLPDVPPKAAFCAEQHADVALVGVGRAFCIHTDSSKT